FAAGRLDMSNERAVSTLRDQTGDEAFLVTAGRVNDRNGATETSAAVSPGGAPDGLFACNLPGAWSGTSEISITARGGAKCSTGLSMSSVPSATAWATTDTTNGRGQSATLLLCASVT